MWSEIKTRLEETLDTVLMQNSDRPIYLWTLDGEVSGRGQGWGWSLQLHFEDPSCQGGVRHVIIGSGKILSPELSDQLKAWFANITQRHPARQQPRIEIYINC